MTNNLGRLVACIFMLAGTLASAQTNGLHQWSVISYPDIACDIATGTATPAISASRTGPAQGLAFTLGFGWPKSLEEQDGFVAPDACNIQMRLHDALGNVSKPIESNFDQPFPRSSHTGRNWHGVFRCVFAWGKNEMDEAWLELVLDDRTYWLEIPYGFTRDPATNELPTSELGYPRIAPAMKSAKASEVVRWRDVFYSVGDVKNDFWVSLKQSNPFDARSVVILGRGIDQPKWALHSPRTSVSIEQGDNPILSGHAADVVLSESDRYRTDGFRYDRYPAGKSERNWGTVVVKVGDRKWTTIVPSSLFKYVHGKAELPK